MVMGNDLGKNLRRYRKEQGLTQEALAEMCKVSRQSLNSYERGKKIPNGRRLHTIADALDIPLITLLAKAGTERYLHNGPKDIEPNILAHILQLVEDYTSLEKLAGYYPYTPEDSPCDRLEGNKDYIKGIAKHFRQRLGLGRYATPNLFTTVEAIGLKVIRYPLPKDLHSMSLYGQGASIILNSQDSVEQQLYQLGCELGNLILCRGSYSQEPGGFDSPEGVVDYFTGHLLIPDDCLELQCIRSERLDHLKNNFRLGYKTILKRLIRSEGIYIDGLLTEVLEAYRVEREYSIPMDNPGPRRYRWPIQEVLLDPNDYPLNERFYNLLTLVKGQINPDHLKEIQARWGIEDEGI